MEKAVKEEGQEARVLIRRQIFLILQLLMFAQDNWAHEELGEGQLGSRAAEFVDRVAADHGKPGGIKQLARQDELSSMLNFPRFHQLVLVSQDF